jgi:HTH-type transcriptional regulator, competence development regulator
MSKRSKRTFGSLVRKEREQRKIGLREMARQIGVSPTYLSMIERGEFPAPAEDKVTAIAKIIGRDRDELLALAGRVSTDLETTIMAHPRLMSGIVRGLSKLLELHKDTHEAEREMHDVEMEMNHVFVRLVELMGESHPEELKEWLKSPELANSLEKLSRYRAALERPSKMGRPVRTSSRSRKLRAKAGPSEI